MSIIIPCASQARLVLGCKAIWIIRPGTPAEELLLPRGRARSDDYFEFEPIFTTSRLRSSCGRGTRRYRTAQRRRGAAPSAGCSFGTSATSCTARPSWCCLTATVGRRAATDTGSGPALCLFTPAQKLRETTRTKTARQQLLRFLGGLERGGGGGTHRCEHRPSQLCNRQLPVS